MSYQAAAIATARRQREQQTPEFKEEYKIRSGIEGTHSTLKCDTGMGELRVRGRPMVRLVVYLKTAACNIKRYIKYALAEGVVCPEMALSAA